MQKRSRLARPPTNGMDEKVMRCRIKKLNMELLANLLGLFQEDFFVKKSGEDNDRR